MTIEYDFKKAILRCDLDEMNKLIKYLPKTELLFDTYMDFALSIDRRAQPVSKIIDVIKFIDKNHPFQISKAAFYDPDKCKYYTERSKIIYNHIVDLKKKH